MGAIADGRQGTDGSAPDLAVLGATRHALHRVAAHVLGRRRYEVTGRFGLRASPGGFTTPAFGDGPEAVRVAGVHLVREVAGEATTVALHGSTLRELAEFAGTDIDRPFDAGAATPEVGDPDAPLEVEVVAAQLLSDWYEFGWQVLDETVAAVAPPFATVQLWPEHFDAGTTVMLGNGRKVNVGVSPGDGFEPEPYLYVGPWEPVTSTDPDYFNAPFGAALRWSSVHGSDDHGQAARQFVDTGLALVAAAPA